MPTDAALNLADLLRQHRLLEPPQLAVLADLQRQFPDPRALAKELVARRWITTYQANQLVAGNVKNLVLGPYALLEKVGEGGMGQVFRARQQRLGRIDAIKVIRKERLDKPDAIKRFYREIRAVSALKHPNIVHAYDADEVDGTHYFAMEFVEGTDLAAVVKKRGPLPVAEACDYVRQAALGLQHAFERGLVHRDIKPHNLLLASGGRKPPGSDPSHRQHTEPGGSRPPLAESWIVKILDMGLARLDAGPADDKSSTMTHEGTVMGTPDYMAPEQTIDSHTVDIRADLYSLGCTLYFLLTGRAPFPGGSLGEKLVKHQLYEPEPIGKFRTDVPGEVLEIVTRLLRKKSVDRYQTPAELATVLEGLFIPPLEKGGGGSSAPSIRSHTVPDEQLAASTPPESRGETMPLVERLRQKRMASQKRWEKHFILGAGIAAGVLIVGLAVFLLIRSLDRGEPSHPPESVAKDMNKKPDAKKPERSPTPEEQEREFQAKRAAEAEAAYPALEAKFKGTGEPGGVSPRWTFESLAKEVAAFKAKHGGTPAALKAAARLMELPSPLDQLDAKKLPADCIAHWRAAGREPPGELVEVLGEHRQRHWATVKSVALSPNGKLVASGGGDGVICLWERETMRLRGLLRGHTGAVTCLAFCPTTSRLVSGSWDSTVRLWDFETLKELRRLPSAANEVFVVALFADGRKGAYVPKDGTVRLWDVESNSEVNRFQLNTREMGTFVFSPDCRRALASSAKDGTAWIWDVETGKELRRLEGHTAIINGAAFTSDCTRVVTGDQTGDVMLWDAETGKQLSRIKRDKQSVSVVAFSPDGRRVINGGSAGSLRLWDCEAANELWRTDGQHFLTAYSVAFSPDGRHLVSCGDDGTVRLWDVDTGKEVRPLTGPVGAISSLDFSPDCTRLVAGQEIGTLRIWSMETGQEVKDLPTTSTRSLAFSPDGTHVLSSAYTGPVLLFDLQSPAQPRNFTGFQGWVRCVAFSPDGKLAAGAGVDHIARVWDTTNATQVHAIDGHTGGTFCVAFSPDGRRLLSGANDALVRLTDVRTGRPVRDIEVGSGGARAVRFLPSGDKAAFRLSGGIVRILDLKTNQHKDIKDLPGQLTEWIPLDISPDGSTIATADLSGRLVLSDTASGAKLHEWQLPGPVYAVAFAADGRHLATANGNGTVYILRIGTPPPDPIATDKKLTELTAKLADPKTDREALRQEVIAFRIKFAGLPSQMVRAAELLAKLPSPLDQLDPAKIPEDAKAHWRAVGREPPGELVGVLGEHRQRHWGSVHCVTYRPDGQVIASCGSDGAIRLYEAETLHPLAELRGHASEVNAIAFSPDNRLLLSGGVDKTVRLWDAITGKVLRQLCKDEELYSITRVGFSGDGRRFLAAGARGVAVVQDLSEDRRLWAGMSGNAVYAAALSPDGKRVLYQNNNKLHLCDTQTNQHQILEGHNEEVRSVAFSRDGTRAVSTGGDPFAILWDVVAGKSLFKYEDKPASAVAFSRDGSVIAVGYQDGTIGLWNAHAKAGESGLVKRFTGHSRLVTSVACSPDGKRIVSGSNDGTIRLWDVNTGKEVQLLTGPVGAMSSIAFAPDGGTIVTGGADEVVRAWDVPLGKDSELTQYSSRGLPFVAVSPDGKACLSNGDSGILSLHDLKTGQLIRRFEGNAAMTGNFYGSVLALAFSPNGQLALSGASDKSVRVWEVATGRELRRFQGHEGTVRSVAFTPDSRKAASASEDATVRVWDVPTGKELHRFQELKFENQSVAISPDGKCVAAGGHNQIHLWRADGEQYKHTTLAGHDAHGLTIVFSPDGRIIASSDRSGMIRLWDSASGIKLREWQLPGPVHSLAFASDSRHLATANGNGTVYILRLPSGRHFSARLPSRLVV